MLARRRVACLRETTALVDLCVWSSSTTAHFRQSYTYLTDSCEDPHNPLSAVTSGPH